MKIGFIGLGIMGKPMSKNLLRAKHQLIVRDLNHAAEEELEGLGAQIATSPKDVAEGSELVITMLPDSQDVRDVVLGHEGIITGGREGLTIIDMSSISPHVSMEIAAILEKRGMSMLDAPVSGGEPKAINGTLSVMAGGKKELFDKYKDILGAMASSVVYIGANGSGNIAKLCNQIIVALNISAVSEALVLAKKAGVSPELVYNAIRGGLAGSAVLDAKAPMMMDRKFSPGFRIDLHIKDLKNVLETSKQMGMALPFTDKVMRIMKELSNEGMGDDDHSSIVKYYEKKSDVKVSR
jgi:2-hydroxy-3-oxopropionate reductase